MGLPGLMNTSARSVKPSRLAEASAPCMEARSRPHPFRDEGKDTKEKSSFRQRKRMRNKNSSTTFQSIIKCVPTKRFALEFT